MTHDLQSAQHRSVETASSPWWIAWIIAWVPAVIVGRQAYFKFLAADGSIDVFTMLDMEPGGRILIGILEWTCVIFLLIPRFSIYGAILCLGTMIGAIIAHATVIGFDGPLLTLFLSGVVAGVSCCTIIFLRRQQVSLIRSMFET